MTLVIIMVKTPARKNLMPAYNISLAESSAEIPSHANPDFIAGKALPHSRQHIIAHMQAVSGFERGCFLVSIGVLLKVKIA